MTIPLQSELTPLKRLTEPVAVQPRYRTLRMDPPKSSSLDFDSSHLSQVMALTSYEFLSKRREIPTELYQKLEQRM